MLSIVIFFWLYSYIKCYVHVVLKVIRTQGPYYNYLPEGSAVPQGDNEIS